MKTDWKSYFYFSRKEFKSILILLIILLLIWIIPYFVHHVNKRSIVEILTEKNPMFEQIDKQMNSIDSAKTARYSKVSPAIQYFEFDPNTIDSGQWIALGVHPNNIRTILKFVNKTKGFQEPNDIFKIYGLPKTIAEKLLPYINIKNNQNKKINEYKTINIQNNNFQNKQNTPQKININTATPFELIKSQRFPKDIAFKIVKYREALGGFINLGQIKKTYNMTDSLYQSILPIIYIDNKSIVLMNINEAKPIHFISLDIFSKEDSYKFINFRNKIEKIQNWEILQNISWIKSNQIDSIKKYFIY